MAFIDHRFSTPDVGQFRNEHRFGWRRVAGEVGFELAAEALMDTGEHDRLLAPEVAAGAVVDGADAPLDRFQVGGGRPVQSEPFE